MQQKLILLTFFVFIVIIIFARSKKNIPLKQYTFLALGDSYTVGECVPVFESFPYQTVQLLRKSGYNFNAAEIVAKTGWTTGELQQGIQNTVFQSSYDIVTLLIGVNNQYRGLNIDEYRVDFEKLLRQAISFADKQPGRVFVLSIPDWGVTPFAKGRETVKIAEEIDAYNAINRKIALEYNVNYIDITPGTRLATQDNGLIANDGLHPSGTEYAIWARQLSADILKQLH